MAKGFMKNRNCFKRFRVADDSLKSYKKLLKHLYVLRKDHSRLKRRQTVAQYVYRLPSLLQKDQWCPKNSGTVLSILSVKPKISKKDL